MPAHVHIRRHPRARRYILRLGPDGGLRLTLPRRGSVEAGLRFVSTQGAWIARERARMAERASVWTPDTLVWFRGARTTVAALLQLPERELRSGLNCQLELQLSPDLNSEVTTAVAVSTPDVTPDVGWRAASEAHMRRLAEQELPPRTRVLAAEHGVAIGEVKVRNQKSRWGACSSRGTITLNWRLIQMPPAVSDYVILHELMHRRQANHSARFWREVAGVCPWWEEAETWIRRHGREIL